MSTLEVGPERASGLVAFDRVWLDDRKRCTWAVCDASFVVDPGSTVALLCPLDQGGAEGVLELLTGRRLPVRGHVSIDGIDLRDLDPIDHLRARAVEHVLDSGERRVTVAGGTTFVVDPTDVTVAAANEVLRFEGGFLATHRVEARTG